MKTIKRKLYCCGCKGRVFAHLTDGSEIYPHLSHLKNKPFWKCRTCGNYVGCHHKTDNPTMPLGSIPTPELRKKRKDIHDKLDPIWRNGALTRSQVYDKLSRRLGYQYHTARIRSLKEAEHVCSVIDEIQSELLKKVFL